MREMIVNELTQATQELVREFAHFLPRLMVMLIVVLVVVNVHFGKSESGVYVPPRWENGRIVPGHVEPQR